MYTINSERYRSRTARQRSYRCRPEVERLEDRRVLAWSMVEVCVSDDAVEPATPEVIVAPHPALATPPWSIDRADAGVVIESRNLHVSGANLSLAGMHLIDPSDGQFEGQVVYLDFDGAREVTYNGPVVVEGIDVPSFQLPEGVGWSGSDRDRPTAADDGGHLRRDGHRLYHAAARLGRVFHRLRRR